MPVSNVVEISLASLVHPDLEKKRKQEIQALESKLKRFGALTIHNLVSRFPNTTTSVFQHNLRNSGYTFVGAGADYTALCKNNQVTKVHRKSVLMTESERKELAARQYAEHLALAASMSDFLVDQTVTIDTHPVQISKRAVQIKQPYVSFEPTSVFSGASDFINENALEEICSRYPKLEQKWIDLAISTEKTYETAGVVPDLTGTANIGIVNPQQLVLIDGQPITHENPVVTEQILRQADQIRALIAA